MTASFKLAASSLVLTAMMGLAACQQPANPPAQDAVPATETEPTASAAKIHAFKLGQLDLVALEDGIISMPMAESPWIKAGAEAQVVTDLFAKAGLPTDKVELGVHPLLVKDGDRLILIDAGAGGQMGTANQLVSALKAAGYEPAQVTDVLISHAHGDHVGGLVKDGALTFPEAKIWFSAAEWRAAQEEASIKSVTEPISSKVQTFDGEAQISPSIRSVRLQGHTAGHTGYEIRSGNDRLIYMGDTFHGHAVPIPAPNLPNVWDNDRDVAAATRNQYLADGVASGVLYYGPHLPFPGLGTIARDGDTYVWKPAR
jgi:glyoxylase-like metal-dependent hydrolase (beta-lactamase superfamily II)